jgi:hypothetical protein
LTDQRLQTLEFEYCTASPTVEAYRDEALVEAFVLRVAEEGEEEEENGDDDEDEKDESDNEDDDEEDRERDGADSHNNDDDPNSDDDGDVPGDDGAMELEKGRRTTEEEDEEEEVGDDDNKDVEEDRRRRAASNAKQDAPPRKWWYPMDTPIEQLDCDTRAVLRRYREPGAVKALDKRYTRSLITVACDRGEGLFRAFRWRWYEGPSIDWDALESSGEQTPIETLRAMMTELLEGPHPPDTPIEQLHADTRAVLRIYRNMQEVTEALGGRCEPSRIATACDQHTAPRYGFRWRWHEGRPIDWAALENSDAQTPVETLRAMMQTMDPPVQQLHIDTNAVLCTHRNMDDALKVRTA